MSLAVFGALFFALYNAQYLVVGGWEPNGGDLGREFSCSSSTYPVGFQYGANINSGFSWQWIGSGGKVFENETKSYIFVMDDPSAAPILGFAALHWIVLDIPPHIKRIPRNVTRTPLVPGREVTNGLSGEIGYLGMCPPKGYFNLYRFTVFARTTPSFTESFDLKNAADVMHKLLSDGNTLRIGAHTGVFPPLDNNYPPAWPVNMKSQ